jgi:hypothetical protein
METMAQRTKKGRLTDLLVVNVHSTMRAAVERAAHDDQVSLAEITRRALTAYLPKVGTKGNGHGPVSTSKGA